MESQECCVSPRISGQTNRYVPMRCRGAKSMTFLFEVLAVFFGLPHVNWVKLLYNTPCFVYDQVERNCSPRKRLGRSYLPIIFRIWLFRELPLRILRLLFDVWWYSLVSCSKYLLRSFRMTRKKFLFSQQHLQWWYSFIGYNSLIVYKLSSVVDELVRPVLASSSTFSRPSWKCLYFP